MSTDARKNVLVLTHVPWEGPGLIAAALAEAGVGLDERSIVHQHNPHLPDVSDIAGLVLMGGPMNAADIAGHPGLAHEAALVRAAVEQSIPVLGICLGHQIIAHALGAPLEANATHEVGLGPIDAAPGGVLAGLDADVVHWHSDNAGLPQGATLLASTPGCPNQAFTVGSAMGLQFHLELDAALLDAWLQEGGMAEELPPGLDADSLMEQFKATEAERSAAAMAIFAPFARAAAANAI
ncbi:type 1 glutamine amidotransferase [Arthrobacter sp. 35W]|uniref:type 1 glutamine amidotransferase n=1 Tax=Arthrobacter sp. 35W TaxID=1132441 RepID=UPI0003FA2089|nr:type 1 glutamine amidotransferase [Arthrobacter sp. 35W]